MKKTKIVVRFVITKIKRPNLPYKEILTTWFLPPGQWVSRRKENVLWREGRWLRGNLRWSRTWSDSPPCGGTQHLQRFQGQSDHSSNCLFLNLLGHILWYLTISTNSHLILSKLKWSNGIREKDYGNLFSWRRRRFGEQIEARLMLWGLRQNGGICVLFLSQILGENGIALVFTGRWGEKASVCVLGVCTILGENEVRMGRELESCLRVHNLGWE